MKRPNIVLIAIDAARADRFSCYGYDKPTTPFLEELMEGRAARFANAFSPAPWTVPAFGSLFSGLFPSRHGANRGHPYLECSSPTLAEALHARGYETFGVSNSSWISSATHFDRGFETFFKVWQLVQDQVDVANQRLQDVFTGKSRQVGARRVLQTILRGSVLKNSLNAFYGYFVYKQGDYGAARVNRSVRSWLRRRRSSDPFFAFVYYLEPHLLYKPPAAFARRFLPEGVSPRQAARVNQDAWAYMTGRVEMTERDFEILSGLYDAEIAYTDSRIRELFGDLEAAGVLDESIVVITADHGENLGEHAMMDHQYCLYDSLLHVPLLVCAPRWFPPGEVYPQIVQSLDIYPTLLGLVDPGAPELDAVQGESLLPATLDSRRRGFAMAEYPEPQPPIEVLRKLSPGFDGAGWDRSLQSIRTEEWKMILGSDDSAELYDIGADPGELRDVAQSHPKVVETLQQVLLRELGPIGAATKKADKDLDPEVLARLRALGYLS